jgi:peptidoglycan/LPS O-acetylase OafA/YrhL
VINADLQSKPITYLGKISCGVYLLQGEVVAFIMVGISFLGGWQKITSTLMTSIGVFIVILAVTSGLAHLSYGYFDRMQINNERY